MSADTFELLEPKREGQFTPTTSSVRGVWLDAYPEEFRGQGGAGFDRWLASVKDSAFAEGYEAASSGACAP